MLKLAVVHAPTGPTQNHGLEAPDMLSGVEEAAMFWGTKPYSRALEEAPAQEIPDKGPRLEKGRTPSGVVVRRVPKKASIVFDYDGTITSDPKWFAKEVAALMEKGYQCHLVTGRPPNEWHIVKAFCEMYGMKFSSFNLYPFPYEFDWVKWDSLLDARIGAWKAGRIRELGASVVVDDHPIHIDRIIKGNPNIVVLCPVGGFR